MVWWRNQPAFVEARKLTTSWIEVGGRGEQSKQSKAKQCNAGIECDDGGFVVYKSINGL